MNHREPDLPELQFRAALQRRGIGAPARLITNGKLQRCDAEGHGGKGDAAYLLHLDGNLPAGGFQNWRDGLGWENWRADIGRLLSPAEQDEYRRLLRAANSEQEADAARRRTEAAARAERIWADAEPGRPDHPYLVRKGIQPHGTRQYRDRVVVPARDGTGLLSTLQFIGQDGTKRFLTGGQVRGCHFLIGEPGNTVCIGEGFATCATVHEATGYAVVIAFDCGNLLPVAQAIRAQFPNARIVLVADDDWRTVGNPGLNKAREAAVAVAGLLAVPGFGTNRPENAKDFNDLGELAGVAAVRQCIEHTLVARSPSMAEARQEDEGSKLSQRDKLVSIADRAQFWRCDDGIAHCTIPVENHHEHHPVRSRAVRDWFIYEAGKAYPVKIAGKLRPGTFGKNAIEDALVHCEAMATINRTKLPARLRVAQTGGSIYLDLGDPEWRAVEIGPAGWRVINHPPVPILRTRRSRTLPLPKPGGSLDPLRELLPIRSEDEFRLLVLWVLSAMRPTGPYPILALSGEQGTGKSLTARFLRRLVDPSGDDIQQPPREDRDLIAAARSNHVLAFDNLSTVNGELADSLCRLATGGDIGGRQLYTDYDSATFAAQRPLIVNGIPDLVSRGDLASRALFIRLAPMRRRRAESELWDAFDAAAPSIFGALLDVLSAAIAVLPTTELPDDSAVFRMADFTLLAIAAEPALGWPSGAALGALRRNIRGAAAMQAELDSVALAIRSLIERDGSFKGLTSNLLAKLNDLVELETKRSRTWPKDATRLSTHLRRIAPALRAVGVDILEERRNRAGQPISIRAAEPSSLSDFGENELDGEGTKPPPADINTPSIRATPATPSQKDGANLDISGNDPGVADVASCSWDEGASYISDGQPLEGVQSNDVAGVSEIPGRFTPAPAPPRWRTVL